MYDKRTDLLLACGVLATPLFFVVAFTMAATRPGFDLGPHMLSQLSAGDLGWVQMANFVVTGILYILGAFGFRRVFTEGPGRVWAPRLLAVFGAGLVAAGVFVADPYKGYPVGGDEKITWHGTLHGVAALVAGVVLVAALLVLARRYYAEGHKIRSVVTVVVAVVYLVLPFSSPDQGGLTLAVGSIIGWGWISVRALLAMPALAGRNGFATAHPA
ncbi:DUF998 domain-containing protein [Nocardia sp. NPDC052566]|uniref:DUF998 domain-containing protein n=1 Tax=Nocardia sp. NPDC052566 TaxID=3364330 RepID=UPI0037C5F3F8